MDKKRGQVQLSFGMIFSIIVIIATVAVAFYAISYFLNLSRCTQTGNFYSLLQNEIDKAWAGEITQKIFSGKLPSGIKMVCLGNMSQSYDARLYGKIHQELKMISIAKNNIYLYPIWNACEGEFASKRLEHAKIEEFFCINVKNNEVKIKLTKGSGEALVTLSKP
ncbi:MAG: hypothetical protein N3D20_01845 [Candidatus Pacearchaeota archaeon]|nr:hypothetical protein [Candidatus Pacearchaeota archaeon]